MKIVVYAICKNEEKFVTRWMESMAEADEVVVLDTGSSDNTVSALQKAGANVVVETISPWRFDVARNRSLDLVPEDADICVCTDLDEVFHPGWREKLENAWNTGCSQAKYRYTWSFTPQGQEGIVFWIEKIHARHGFRWIHPVHEVLQWVGEKTPGPVILVDGIQLDHHPDPEKSRGQYLPLLELSVQEEPHDDRNVHYLGREYMYHGQWDDCIRTLKHHLQMPQATWKDERAASMRYLAKAYWNKGEDEEAKSWYLQAIAQAPYLREAYMDLAWMLYEEEEWEGVLYFTGCALKLTERPKTYISEAAAWGSLPHDLRSIAFDRLGLRKQGLEEAKKALALEPDNERLQKNIEVMEESIET